MKKCFLVSLLFVAIILMSVDCYAFRCGNDIVSKGDSSAAVTSKCGKPDWQETIKTETKGTYSGGGSKVGKYSEVTEKVEKWYYNCGQFDFIYVLTIKAGQLVKIETAGRGSGESRCQLKKENKKK